VVIKRCWKVHPTRGGHPEGGLRFWWSWGDPVSSERHMLEADGIESEAAEVVTDLDGDVLNPDCDACDSDADACDSDANARDLDGGVCDPNGSVRESDEDRPDGDKVGSEPVADRLEGAGDVRNPVGDVRDPVGDVRDPVRDEWVPAEGLRRPFADPRTGPTFHPARSRYPSNCGEPDWKQRLAYLSPAFLPLLPLGSETERAVGPAGTSGSAQHPGPGRRRSRLARYRGLR